MRYTLKIDLKPKKFVIKEIKGIGAANAYEFDKTIHPETTRRICNSSQICPLYQVS